MFARTFNGFIWSNFILGFLEYPIELAAIPMYPMCVSRLQDKLCNEIDAVVVRFWRPEADKVQGIHWIKWMDMGRPKRDGGMGFQNFKDFNIALLSKQCWRLIHDPESLWARVLRERYFPNVSFLEAKKYGMTSWAWASLLEGRYLILKGARWQILGGHEVRFWTDNWVLGIPAGHPSPPLHSDICRVKVAEFLDPVSRNWDLAPVSDLGGLCCHFKYLCRAIYDSRPFERNGSYSVKSGYRWSYNNHPPLRHDCPTSSRTIDPRVWD